MLWENGTPESSVSLISTWNVPVIQLSNKIKSKTLSETLKIVAVLKANGHYEHPLKHHCQTEESALDVTSLSLLSSPQLHSCAQVMIYVWVRNYQQRCYTPWLFLSAYWICHSFTSFTIVFRFFPQGEFLVHNKQGFVPLYCLLDMKRCNSIKYLCSAGRGDFQLAVITFWCNVMIKCISFSYIFSHFLPQKRLKNNICF